MTCLRAGKACEGKCGMEGCECPPYTPDFVKLAQSYGALGIRVEREEEIIPALKQAIEYDGPVMIDFICENFEMVYPWVLAGQPIDKVLLSREEC
jgi:acetolactate synthase-1/2/3 large subunit